MTTDLLLQYISEHPGASSDLAFVPELQTNELEVIQLLTVLVYNGYLIKLNRTHQITNSGKLYLQGLKVTIAQNPDPQNSFLINNAL